jgi:ABC-type multidrug transport system ATPase subunit
MISVHHINKSFGKDLAVSDVSLEIEKGKIFGLLGPNAAGKTTLIRMICGIIKSDAGTISINGVSIKEAKQNFGYVAQYFGQYEELSVWENLTFYAQMYGIDDEVHLESLLERYKLLAFKERRAGKLSGGYKRRLALACALAHDPDVLFLDEPTAGIDPVTRKLLWDDFYELSQQGKTLFVTTHYMEEAERCDELAFIVHGKIIAQGTPQSIKEALGNVHVFAVKTAYNPALHNKLKALEGVKLLNQFGNELRCIISKKLDAEDLQKASELSLAFYPCEASLEDVFIELSQEAS